MSKHNYPPDSFHWSFDHPSGHGTAGNYHDELLRCLESARQGNGDIRKDRILTLHYAVLPNFWDGFAVRSETPLDKVQFGSLRIQRMLTAGGSFECQVRYTNDASGEELELTYCTGTDVRRPLLGGWTLRAQNRAGDLYKEMSVSGSFRDRSEEREIELEINGRLPVVAGRVPIQHPITCNWSLFDCLGEAIEAKERRFHFLEDLEKLKEDCRFSPYERTEVPLRDGPLVLDGSVLYGPGQGPSYWWLDGDGHVAIMSNVFNTFVLKEISGTDDSAS